MMVSGNVSVVDQILRNEEVKFELVVALSEGEVLLVALAHNFDVEFR